MSDKIFHILKTRFIKDLLEQFPRPVFIGIGQGRALRALGDPLMLQLPETTGQAITNLPQRMGLAQLAEEHRDLMAPTGKTLGRKLGAGLPDKSFKVPPRKNGLQSAEKAAIFFRRLS